MAQCDTVEVDDEADVIHRIWHHLVDAGAILLRERVVVLEHRISDLDELVGIVYSGEILIVDLTNCVDLSDLGARECHIDTDGENNEDCSSDVAIHDITV